MTSLPYRVVTRIRWIDLDDNAKEVRDWLVHHIGKPYERWVTEYDVDHDRYCVKFVDRYDAAFFRLVWS